MDTEGIIKDTDLEEQEGRVELLPLHNKTLIGKEFLLLDGQRKLFLKLNLFQIEIVMAWV